MCENGFEDEFDRHPVRLPMPPIGYIRIMKMPPGKAPKKVRKAWIGCLLPVVDIIKVGDETRTGKNVRRNLYRVPADKAFGLLARHDLEAVDWWKKNKPQAFKYWQTLGFPKSCLRFIPVV